jgi:3-hydroxybutyrate dehydrogenase
VIHDVLLHAQPTKQFVQVEEIAALATFLASDSATSLTGAIIPVDGGWTAQ